MRTTAAARGRPELIEERNARGELNRAEVLSGLFADMRLLSAADAFVGTAGSWTSRILLLSIIGERARVPPFFMVDAPLGSLWKA